MKLRDTKYIDNHPGSAGLIGSMDTFKGGILPISKHF